MKFSLALLGTVVVCNALAQLKLPDMKRPPGKAELLTKSDLCTFMNERDFTMSPDGTEIFYTIAQPKFSAIVRSVKQPDGTWSIPEVASFSGRFADLEAAFSPDGKVLYFASNRPLEGESPKDFDLWKVEKTKDGWGAAVHLGDVVNSAGNEFYPSVTRDGSIFFTASLENGVGMEDIFVSRLKGGEYQSPEPLDTAVNSKTYEFNAFVAPDESYLIFSSYGRADDLGGGDLYVSHKDKDGKWKQAVHLGSLNSPSLDYCPFVSFDGKALFFTSERHDLPSSLPTHASAKALVELSQKVLNGRGNIYWISAEVLSNGGK